MVEGLQQASGRATSLAIILHGWGGSPAAMQGVIDAARAALASGGDVDIFAPTLPYARHLSSVRADAIVVTLLSQIDQVVAERGPYEHIYIIGYSLGAMVARRVFLHAAGNIPGFRNEIPEGSGGSRSWAPFVERLVTLSAFNRGWQVTGRTSWYSSFILNLMGLIGHLSPENWRPTIFDMRLGAPFTVQTRLHWLAYRRWHHALRARALINESHYSLPVSQTRDPIVVQLIGTEDDVASPLDQVDIAVDGSDRGGQLPPNRRYFFIETADTDHDHAIDFSATPAGENRRRLFIEALTQPQSRLHTIASDPSLLADDIAQVEPEVTHTVFIIHGIRDDGFWTHRIAKAVRERATDPLTIRARTPTYGYFAMLPFILPWIRRQKVEWLMDHMSAWWRNSPTPSSAMWVIRTALIFGARALRDYAAAKFKHVFFAGSVVKRKYDWRAPILDGRVQHIHNVPASADWVVALLPKSIEHWPRFDLGGAGFDGFNDAGSAGVTQPKQFAKGGHGAAIDESQWPYIADYIINGTVPSELPATSFVPARSSWLVPLAKSHLSLPLLVAIFGLGIPIAIAWHLLHALGGNSAMLASAYAVGLVAYFLVLHFVITRV